MKKIILSIITISLLFSGCNESDKGALLPNVTGKSGEVILVIESKLWNSDIGTEFKRKLNQAYPALPQSEPIFDVVQIPYSSFTNIFKTHRNVIVVKIDKDLHEPKMIVQENLWSKPQIIVNVLAPDEESLENLIRDNGDLLVDRILRKELERYANNYKKYEQIGFAELTAHKFGVRLTIPKGYSMDLDTTNFMWFESRGRGDVVQGILIYSYDLPEVELTTDYLFTKRTQFTKRFVPGPVDNSYMAVETETKGFRREIEVNGIDIIELRNLWKVENDFMGGPFISYTFVDKEKNKVVSIDGFVFAPQYDKRDYLRQVEAILSSIQIPMNESAN